LFSLHEALTVVFIDSRQLILRHLAKTGNREGGASLMLTGPACQMACEESVKKGSKGCEKFVDVHGVEMNKVD
jgi:hypothetical protein